MTRNRAGLEAEYKGSTSKNNIYDDELWQFLDQLTSISTSGALGFLRLRWRSDGGIGKGWALCWSALGPPQSCEIRRPSGLLSALTTRRQSAVWCRRRQSKWRNRWVRIQSDYGNLLRTNPLEDCSVLRHSHSICAVSGQPLDCVFPDWKGFLPRIGNQTAAVDRNLLCGHSVIVE